MLQAIFSFTLNQWERTQELREEHDIGEKRANARFTLASQLCCSTRKYRAPTCAPNRPFYRYGGHLEFYCFD